MHLLKQTPSEKGEFSPPIPEPVEDKLKPHYQEYIQTEYEIFLFKKLPEMSRQLHEMEDKAAKLHRVYQIIEAGYEPFVPSTAWHTGFLSKPQQEKGLGTQTHNLYKHPLPLNILEKYLKAKQTGFFSVFSVHSPDAGAFRQYGQLSPIDPVLVGWIRSAFVSAHGSVIGDSTISTKSFLIGAWDLAKDLKYNPAQISEHTSS